MKPVVLVWIPRAVDNIALVQSTGAAGPLILNGPNVDFSPNARFITLTSANNNAAVNFTVTGNNLYGVQVSEVIAGPNANTVSGAVEFTTVISVVANAAVNQVSIGLSQEGIAGTYLYDYHAPNSDLGVQVIVGGVINYDLSYSFNDVPNIYDVAYHPVAGMTGATTNQWANVIQPTRYVYIFVNASNIGATLVATLIQQGLR